MGIVKKVLDINPHIAKWDTLGCYLSKDYLDLGLRFTPRPGLEMTCSHIDFVNLAVL